MDDLTHLVSALKDIPDYKVPEIFDDMATPDFVVSTRKLTETKNCVLKWVISLFNGIKSGDAFKSIFPNSETDLDSHLAMQCHKSQTRGCKRYVSELIRRFQRYPSMTLRLSLWQIWR